MRWLILTRSRYQRVVDAENALIQKKVAHSAEREEELQARRAKVAEDKVGFSMLLVVVIAGGGDCWWWWWQRRRRW